MKFYRRLKPFKAISFDLDDTLYSNQPVMMATDVEMKNYFAQLLPPINGNYDYHYWFTFRAQALTAQPALQHDVGALRLQSYYLGIRALGFDNEQAQVMAQEAFDYFVLHRSDFTVPDNIHQLMTHLKKHWPLIAISNGNVDTKKIGIADYFTEIFHADLCKRQKPCRDMFDLACKSLAIEPESLLHIGDCGKSDIYGAISAGCQTAWVSTYDVGKPLTVLPNFELSDVTELTRLI